MLTKLLLAGLLCTTLALAQAGGGGGGRKESVSGGTGGGGPRGGAPPQVSRFEDIATALNLTKDQRKSVRTILDEGAKEATPVREQLSKSRIVVGEAIIASKPEEELKQVAKTSSDLAVQLSQVELRTFAKVYGALDDTQRKDLRGLGHVLSLMNEMYHTKNWQEE